MMVNKQVIDSSKNKDFQEWYFFSTCIWLFLSLVISIVISYVEEIIIDTKDFWLIFIGGGIFYIAVPIFVEKYIKELQIKVKEILGKVYEIVGITALLLVVIYIGYLVRRYAY